VFDPLQTRGGDPLQNTGGLPTSEERQTKEPVTMTERRYSVAGEIDLANCQALQDRLRALANVTDDDLVLDCAAMTFVDATGIGVFVRTQELLERDGRRFRLEHVSPRCQRVFEILDVDDMMGLRESALRNVQ
jgi:anti-anti-sigma factor